MRLTPSSRQLVSPDGVIFEGPAEQSGSFTFTAKSAGVHSFEFINSEPQGTVPRKVSFNLLGSTQETGKTREQQLVERVGSLAS